MFEGRLYSVTTWDSELQEFTPQDGLMVPALGVDLAGVRAALRELRTLGYSCHRRRGPDGAHFDNDAAPSRMCRNGAITPLTKSATRQAVNCRRTTSPQSSPVTRQNPNRSRAWN